MSIYHWSMSQRSNSFGPFCFIQTMNRTSSSGQYWDFSAPPVLRSRLWPEVFIKRIFNSLNQSEVLVWTNTSCNLTLQLVATLKLVSPLLDRPLFSPPIARFYRLYNNCRNYMQKLSCVPLFLFVLIIFYHFKFFPNFLFLIDCSYPGDCCVRRQW